MSVIAMRAAITGVRYGRIEQREGRTRPAMLLRTGRFQAIARPQQRSTADLFHVASAAKSRAHRTVAQ
jgi:hypothetical protein